MNRRGFFRRTLGALVAAVLPITTGMSPVTAAFRRSLAAQLRYRGVPIVYDPNCPRNTIYFIDPERTYFKHIGMYQPQVQSQGERKLGVITKIN